MPCHKYNPLIISKVYKQTVFDTEQSSRYRTLPISGKQAADSYPLFICSASASIFAERRAGYQVPRQTTTASRVNVITVFSKMRKGVTSIYSSGSKIHLYQIQANKQRRDKAMTSNTSPSPIICHNTIRREEPTAMRNRSPTAAC